jgi:hypothetical protein
MEEYLHDFLKFLTWKVDDIALQGVESKDNFAGLILEVPIQKYETLREFKTINFPHIVEEFRASLEADLVGGSIIPKVPIKVISQVKRQSKIIAEICDEQYNRKIPWETVGILMKSSSMVARTLAELMARDDDHHLVIVNINQSYAGQLGFGDSQLRQQLKLEFDEDAFFPNDANYDLYMTSVSVTPTMRVFKKLTQLSIERSHPIFRDILAGSWVSKNTYPNPYLSSMNSSGTIAGCNDSQMVAINSVLTMQNESPPPPPIVIIHGPPGTGNNILKYVVYL